MQIYLSRIRIYSVENYGFGGGGGVSKSKDSNLADRVNYFYW